LKLIEVDHLSKQYGSLVAVNDLSFTVNKGEIVGFLGPNGAGKTTTMRILTGYLPATQGTARIAGFDIFDSPLEVKRRIGYLPEHPPVYRDMYVRSYLTFVSKIKGVPNGVRRERIDQVMERCGIQDRAGQLIGQLSKGYQQRVGIAQAIVHNPDVIILDEPTIGLDPNQIRDVRHLVKGLAREHTVILSTHILPEVEMTCDRVVIINKGQIAAVDSPKNLMDEVAGQQKLRVEVAGDVAAAERIAQGVPGVVSVSVVKGENPEGIAVMDLAAPADADIRAELSKRLVGAGLDLLELRGMAASLEDIFHQLTTTEETGD
jgi:ABC-2 type transport system ATP-binding protein